MAGYSDQHLKDALQSLADDLGYPPSTTDMRTNGRHDPTTYLNRWPSWNDALEAAGLTPRDPTRPSSPDELIQDLTTTHDGLEHAPRRQDIADQADHHPQTFANAFGSLEAALDAADIPTYNLGYIIPRESLRAEIERVAETLGYPPNTTEIVEHGDHALETYQRRWGSFDAALEAAGYTPPAEDARIHREQLLAELTRLYETFGSPPDKLDMRFHGQFSVAPYDRAFDSWTDALKAANIPHRTPTNEALKDDLTRLADKLGRTPSYDDIDTHGRYGTSTYYQRFGSIKIARAAAGLPETL